LRKVLNINPDKDSFTVKITGGPDGDVAGNLMRILFRDYGNNCKVVGVADGFGVAEDPNGLDSEELLRLVKASLPITEFNKSKLSRQGIAMAANTDEGMQRRNTMHFRVKADAFVPAGGRPNTTNITNWRQFLMEDGKPSSQLMVEGANIFTTQEARELLFEHGKVAIVKDSSANKCGVMTSSYEVAASMLMSKEEFMPLKPQIVEDVLVRLRHVARLEADLLFREYRNYPGALPHFSERISFAIAKVTDAITDALANVNPEDKLFQELFPIIRENLPAKLAEVAGDRIASRYPVQYQRNAIASGLASKIVYAEGVHLIEQQPLEHVAERAFAYYRADQKVQSIIRSLEKQDFGTNAAVKPVVIDILKKAGARASVDTL
jgi:glutamate dehydrogenase